MPMGLNSTQLLSYGDIKTGRIDLFEDAFGFIAEFQDVLKLIDRIKPEPDKHLVEKLMRKIRTENS